MLLKQISINGFHVQRRPVSFLAFGCVDQHQALFFRETAVLEPRVNGFVGVPLLAHHFGHVVLELNDLIFVLLQLELKLLVALLLG